MKRVWTQIQEGNPTVYAYEISKRRRLSGDRYSSIKENPAVEFPLAPLNSDVWSIVLSHIDPKHATILRWVSKYFTNEQIVVRQTRTDGKKLDRTYNRVTKEAIVSTGNGEFIRQLPIQLSQCRLKYIMNQSLLRDELYDLFRWSIRQGVGIPNSISDTIISIGSEKAFRWLLRRPKGLYWKHPSELLRSAIVSHRHDRYKFIMDHVRAEPEVVYHIVLVTCTWAIEVDKSLYAFTNQHLFNIEFPFKNYMYCLFRCIKQNREDVFDGMFEQLKEKIPDWATKLQEYFGSDYGDFNPLCAALFQGSATFVEKLLPYAPASSGATLVGIAALSPANNVPLIRRLLEVFHNQGRSQTTNFNNSYVQMVDGRHPENFAFLRRQGVSIDVSYNNFE